MLRLDGYDAGDRVLRPFFVGLCFLVFWSDSRLYFGAFIKCVFRIVIRYMCCMYVIFFVILCQYIENIIYVKRFIRILCLLGVSLFFCTCSDFRLSIV